MCLPSPKAPRPPVAPPPPAPLALPELGKPEDSVEKLKKKKQGVARLQIPLGGSLPSSGLSIPV